MDRETVTLLQLLKQYNKCILLFYLNFTWIDQNESAESLLDIFWRTLVAHPEMENS